MIPLFKPFMAPDVLERLAPILTYREDGSMYIGEGAKVEELESKFRTLCNLPHLPLAVNSGTSALELALFLAGVKPGDEVISTPITCSATNSAILTHYANIVWADVDPLTGLIDPLDVADKLTSKTKAIVAVNWGGSMPNYSALKAFGIPVIEDAAHGPYQASVERGDYIAWSTQAIKFLTTGDGGFLYTPVDQYDNGRLARWFGLDRKSSASFRCAQNIQIVGRKLHMNDIAATIGLANIEYVPLLVKAQQNLAETYHRQLAGIPKVTLIPFDPYSSYWIYTLLVDNPVRFMAFLKEHGIDSSPVHARNDKHTAFNFYNGPLPGVDFFDNHQVSIPVGWWLTDSEVERIVDTVIIYGEME